MVCARIRNNRIPDDRLIRHIVIRGRGSSIPRRGNPDEDLFGVPGEEGGEVSGQREPDVGVFFFAVGVVVWAAAEAVYLLAGFGIGRGGKEYT